MNIGPLQNWLNLLKILWYKLSQPIWSGEESQQGQPSAVKWPKRHRQQSKKVIFYR